MTTCTDPLARLRDLQKTVRQWRGAWQDTLEKENSEAGDRENWDGSTNNLGGFLDVMDAIEAIPAAHGEEGRYAPLTEEQKRKVTDLRSRGERGNDEK